MMGTLFNQPERSRQRAYSIEDEISFIQAISKDYSIPFVEVVALMDVLERRRTNDLALANGDIHDEQMAGFGELVDRLATAVENLKYANNHD